MKKKIILWTVFVLLIVQSVFAASSYSQLVNGVSQVSLMKSYKNLNVNMFALSKTKKQAKNLSEADKSIITKYVYGAVKGEDTYLLMNSYLRGNLNLYLNPKDITKPLKSRMEYYSNSLAGTISKVKLPQNTILYRGVDEKGFCFIFPENNIHEYTSKPVTDTNGIALKNKLYSKTFVEKGFMSTAYDINYAKKTKFIFEIKAPKNIQAVLVDGIRPESPQTKEIIINRGYKWKVTDVAAVDGSYYKITLKLVL